MRRELKLDGWSYQSDRESIFFKTRLKYLTFLAPVRQFGAPDLPLMDNHSFDIAAPTLIKFGSDDFYIFRIHFLIIPGKARQKIR